MKLIGLPTSGVGEGLALYRRAIVERHEEFGMSV